MYSYDLGLWDMGLGTMYSYDLGLGTWDLGLSTSSSPFHDSHLIPDPHNATRSVRDEILTKEDLVLAAFADSAVTCQCF